MTATQRASDVRVSAAPVIRRAGGGRPESLLGWALRGLACGIVLGLVVGTGFAPSPALVLVLGCLTLAWLLLSFGSERPGDPFPGRGGSTGSARSRG